MITRLLVLAPLLLGAQTERAVFRATTRAVQIDVFVGKDDKAVSGLSAADFEVYDEGTLQEILVVDTASVPLDVAMVLDTSQSVAGSRLDHLRRAAGDFIRALQASDRVALHTFSHYLERVSDLTSDHAALIATTETVQSHGATAWRDALFAGLKTVEGAQARPLVLLFTDGADTYSWLGESQMLPLIEQSDAVVYAIGHRDRATAYALMTNSIDRRRQLERARQENAGRNKLLRQLTTASGGRLLQTQSAEDLQPVFLQILGEMKTRYLLTYQLPPDAHPGWHDVEVKVKRRGVDVRARRGYFHQEND